MLYPERMRLKELAEREAAGEDVWTRELSKPVRQKIWYAIADAVDDEPRYSIEARRFYDFVHKFLCRALGRDHLFNPTSKAEADIQAAVLHKDVDLVLGIVEAVAHVLRVVPYNLTTDADRFERRVNRDLRSHRCSYELVGIEVVPFESQEMHDEVVAPTLRLLSGRPGWEDVEQAYQDALKEIGDDASDAITDAGTALQEALKMRGCKGNGLGPLLKDAKAKGILAPHDPTLGNAIGKLIDWTGADRSELGDGHKAVTGAQPQDAWLAVHVVGALILRLARGDKRPLPKENGGS